jgi:hypothetical protein
VTTAASTTCLFVFDTGGWGGSGWGSRDCVYDHSGRLLVGQRGTAGQENDRVITRSLTCPSARSTVYCLGHLDLLLSRSDWITDTHYLLCKKITAALSFV